MPLRLTEPPMSSPAAATIGLTHTTVSFLLMPLVDGTVVLQCHEPWCGLLWAQARPADVVFARIPCKNVSHRRLAAAARAQLFGSRLCGTAASATSPPPCRGQHSTCTLLHAEICMRRASTRLDAEEHALFSGKSQTLDCC